MVFKKMMKTIKTIKTSKSPFFPSLTKCFKTPRKCSTTTYEYVTGSSKESEGSPRRTVLLDEKILWGLDEVNKISFFQKSFDV
jgi:hypothetical protein